MLTDTQALYGGDTRITFNSPLLLLNPYVKYWESSVLSPVDTCMKSMSVSILPTCSLDNVFALLGEISFKSLLGMKWLNVVALMKMLHGNVELFVRLQYFMK